MVTAQVANNQQVVGVGPNYPYDPIKNPTGYGKPNQNDAIGAAIAKASAPVVANVKAATAAPVTTPAIGATIAQTSYTPVNPYAENPYTDPTTREKGRADFTAALQPQIRTATDAVTSNINPYMKGNIGASLLRNVQAPATQALADYETEQNKLGTDITLKGQEWEANQAKTNLDNLATLANSSNATAEDQTRYRAALLGQTYTPTTTTTPTTTNTSGSTPDYSKLSQGALDAIITNAKSVIGKGNATTDASYNAAMNQRYSPGQNIDYVAQGTASTPATNPQAQKIVKQAKTLAKSIADEILTTSSGSGDWVGQDTQKGLNKLNSAISSFTDQLDNSDPTIQQEAIDGLTKLLTDIKTGGSDYVWKTYIQPTDSRLNARGDKLSGMYLG